MYKTPIKQVISFSKMGKSWAIIVFLIQQQKSSNSHKEKKIFSFDLDDNPEINRYKYIHSSYSKIT